MVSTKFVVTKENSLLSVNVPASRIKAWLYFPILYSRLYIDLVKNLETFAQFYLHLHVITKQSVVFMTGKHDKLDIVQADSFFRNIYIT